MKQSNLKTYSTHMIHAIGRIGGLGLLIFVFAYSQSALARSAVTGSRGNGALEQAPRAEAETEILYLPLIFNNFDPARTFKFFEVDDLVISTLNAETDGHWFIYLTGGDTITLSAAPGMMVDIILSVFDEDGIALVDNQNLSPAGEVETIGGFTIPETGRFEVVVGTAQGDETDYALMLLDQDSYPFVLQGTFFENGSKNGSLPLDTDNFWFFNAQSGQHLSFTVTPSDEGDPYVELYNPAVQRLLVIDDNLDGEPESLENYTLLDSGLYAIRIGEFNFLTMDYQITLSVEE